MIPSGSDKQQETNKKERDFSPFFQPLETITRELIDKCARNGGNTSILSIVTCTQTSAIYALPKKYDTIHFATELQNAGIKEDIIPSHIELQKKTDTYTILGVLTGISSQETGIKTHNSRKNLKEAHEKVLALIKKSTPPLEAHITENRILYTYANAA